MSTRMSLCRVIWAAPARFGALAWLIMAVGCTTTTPPSPTTPAAVAAAHLVIINQTNYTWRISIASTAGKETFAAPVPPQASANAELAGGDYLIEQTIISNDATPGPTRRLPARLEPGQTYHWRLDTLLSNTAGDPTRDLP